MFPVVGKCPKKVLHYLLMFSAYLCNMFPKEVLQSPMMPSANFPIMALPAGIMKVLKPSVKHSTHVQSIVVFHDAFSLYPKETL